MSFSESMRDSLGSEGAKVELSLREQKLERSATCHAAVEVRGGSRPARLEALRVELVELRRYWVDATGKRADGADSLSRRERNDLTPAWTRHTVAQQVVEAEADVEPGATHSVEVEIQIPANCHLSGPSAAISLCVQADVKDQIDPSANANLTIV